MKVERLFFVATALAFCFTAELYRRAVNYAGVQAGLARSASEAADRAIAAADQWREHSKNLEALVERETVALSNLNVFIQARLSLTNGVLFQPIPWNELTNGDFKLGAENYQATASNFTNVLTNTVSLLGNDVRAPLSNLFAKPLIQESIAASDAEALLRDAREYGALTNLVKLLVERGEFCRIQGHAWCADLKGYPREQAEKPEWRECLVCGREEERARRIDKWHHSNP